jgi:hypothetical protein
MSICVIIYILYYNSITFAVGVAFVLPLSIDKISYFHEIKFESTVYIDSEIKHDRFHLIKINEVSDFLSKLDINDNYIATIEFIPELSDYNIDAPQLILSKPFLINRFSSPTTLSIFIIKRLNYMVDYYYLDDTIIQECKDGTGPGIIINYTKFYL